jgi:hypothetical protein
LRELDKGGRISHRPLRSRLRERREEKIISFPVDLPSLKLWQGRESSKKEAGGLGGGVMKDDQVTAARMLYFGAFQIS